MGGHGERITKIKFYALNEVLKEKGKKWQYLIDNGISSGIVAKMKNGKGDISTATIERVCELLDCQPGDIMEYVPDCKGKDEK